MYIRDRSRNVACKTRRQQTVCLKLPPCQSCQCVRTTTLPLISQSGEFQPEEVRRNQSHNTHAPFIRLVSRACGKLANKVARDR